MFSPFLAQTLSGLITLFVRAITAHTSVTMMIRTVIVTVHNVAMPVTFIVNTVMLRLVVFFVMFILGGSVRSFFTLIVVNLICDRARDPDGD
jgi:hypothetical protein